jgi:hypothetical protein
MEIEKEKSLTLLLTKYFDSNNPQDMLRNINKFIKENKISLFEIFQEL